MWMNDLGCKEDSDLADSISILSLLAGISHLKVREVILNSE